MILHPSMVPVTAEVLDTFTFTPETAANEGQREATIRTKRGFPYRFIGTIRVERSIERRDYLDGGSGDWELKSRTEQGYAPVLMAGAGEEWER
jgi:hypothetical protein